MKRILMVAFHYPPFEGGSGIHRTLKFSRYLPEFGWHPIVLSANPIAYSQVSDERLSEIPVDVPVKRAFAWDTAKQLAIGGRYLKWMALPDRWFSWWFGGVPAGLTLIRKYQPQIIWSTYPIATAHLIGLTLHRLTGIPWIADFRDSMSEDDYPTDPTVRSIYRWIERHTVKSCDRALFTTPGALDMYAKRYPDIPQDRWRIIANGYDEEDFVIAERSVAQPSVPRGLITLVHSGLLYSSERNPLAFFAALGELRRSGKISPSSLRVVLRGSGNEEFYGIELRKNNLDDIVKLEPAIPYRDALVEILRADGLLIFQGSNCNHQIPAKLYECLRASRPILVLTDPNGDTAALLRQSKMATVVPLDSRDEIMNGLSDFLIHIREGIGVPIAYDVDSHSRKGRTRELVALLESFN